jgi:hypothetical protein
MVKTYACKANFVTKMMESTNAILGIFKVVILDESKSVMVSVGQHDMVELTPCTCWTCDQ